MKTKIIKILIITSVLILTSCSTEKKLKRSVEKHGIKESISFVTTTYPEYFKAESVTLHDTLYVEKIVTIEKEYDFTSTLDSLKAIYEFENEQLKFSLSKKTGKVKFQIKNDTILVRDTINITTKCPEIICPDIDKLDTNSTNSNIIIVGLIFILILIIIIIIILYYNYKNIK